MKKTHLSSSEIQDLINKYQSESKKLEFQLEGVSGTISELQELLTNVNKGEISARATVKSKKVKLKKTTTPASSKKITEKVTKGKPGRPKKSEAKPLVTKKAVTSSKVAKGKPGRKPKAKEVIEVKVASKRGRKKAIKVIAEPKIAAKRGRKKIEKEVTKPKEEKKGYKLSPWDQDLIDSIRQSDRVLITQELIDLVKLKTQEKNVKTTDEEIKNKVTRSLQKLANRRGDLIKIPYKGKGFAYAVSDWKDSKGKIDKKYKR